MAVAVMPISMFVIFNDADTQLNEEPEMYLIRLSLETLQIF